MIENVTNNSFLAAAFGAIGVSRRPMSQPIRGGAAQSSTGRIDRTAFPQPVDSVQFSAPALRQASRGDAEIHPPAPVLQQPAHTKTGEPGASAGATPSASDELTVEEQDQQRELEKRDQEVRRHEQAHAAAAGAHTRGGPSFEFETGPDGKQYAVAGEVQIDTTPVRNDPQATVTKMQQVRRAALAPANPSAQDRAVAANAASEEQKARAELVEKRQDSRSGNLIESPVTKGRESKTDGRIPTSDLAAFGALVDLLA